jgi:hypothetical protein
VPFWSVRTKSLPDLLMQPEMVVWSPDELPVEAALEPLWLPVDDDPAAAPWSAAPLVEPEPEAAPAPWSPEVEPVPLAPAPPLPAVDPEPDPPACANVMPAVMSRMLVK